MSQKKVEKHWPRGTERDGMSEGKRDSETDRKKERKSDRIKGYGKRECILSILGIAGYE